MWTRSYYDCGIYSTLPSAQLYFTKSTSQCCISYLIVVWKVVLRLFAVYSLYISHIMLILMYPEQLCQGQTAWACASSINQLSSTPVAYNFCRATNSFCNAISSLIISGDISHSKCFFFGNALNFRISHFLAESTGSFSASYLTTQRLISASYFSKNRYWSERLHVRKETKIEISLLQVANLIKNELVE